MTQLVALQQRTRMWHVRGEPCAVDLVTMHSNFQVHQQLNPVPDPSKDPPPSSRQSSKVRFEKTRSALALTLTWTIWRIYVSILGTAILSAKSIMPVILTVCRHICPPITSSPHA